MMRSFLSAIEAARRCNSAKTHYGWLVLLSEPVEPLEPQSLHLETVSESEKTLLSES